VARQAPVLEPPVPVMVPRRVMEPQVLAMTPRRVRKARVPVMTPRVRVQVMVPRVRAGEAPAGLPQARAAEVAQEVVCAMLRPPARVCRSSTSP
jgi:hypothetical protein